MYSTRHYTYTPSSSSNTMLDGLSTGAGIWVLVSLILAVIGGILVYCLFVRNKKDFKENKLLAWLKRFLDFKTLWIEGILKVTYIIFALFVTLASFAFIGSNFLSFLCILILGNLFVRLIYEGSLVILAIWRNTSEINQKVPGAKSSEKPKK